ncbi:hypothetical protein A3H16_02890 [Candidatus Kaiserbacteria bacterium RIFCSPLOWO2_12_FULL_53_8]|uniref:Uncharacterized protein n=2 Tax=Candidatus Kaiseribacteriota TaxID=1752734 RepID=A0A1F6CXP5_9BACT|nr:MAG: hypothetical protein A2851_03500 [Candidatus Kaiserbacteria bacterium RIFCSPHIGHO2_01_FULL_53_29]OGG92213.1 MAG: hypothetical protein A3H16_02890 [Candidatus Kaiserbacteria bacterium RIFCSPLOWO2_12_FULL_53_8]
MFEHCCDGESNGAAISRKLAGPRAGAQTNARDGAHLVAGAFPVGSQGQRQDSIGARPRPAAHSSILIYFAGLRLAEVASATQAGVFEN